VDRLTMLLTNSTSIRELILFPHLRAECEGSPLPLGEGGAKRAEREPDRAKHQKR